MVKVKNLLVLLFCIQVAVTFAKGQNEDCFKELRRYGGIATFDLHIKDELGRPVDHADGSAWFWYRNSSTLAEGTSDENGRLLLSNSAKVDGGYTIRKKGYYNTVQQSIYFEAPSEPFGFLERRRWKPVVQNVTLKTKRNPTSMFSHTLYCKPIPKWNTSIGFDLQVADWIKPYGEGNVVDVYITVYTAEAKIGKRMRQQPSKIVFDFPQRYDGVQIHNADKWSEFISSYMVDLEEPFSKQLELTPDKSNYPWFSPSKYIVFRSRSKENATGELESCHYGKIYPSIDVTADGLSIMSIIFNPVSNSTNLEFDPQRNLTNKSSLHGSTQRQSAP